MTSLIALYWKYKIILRDSHPRSSAMLYLYFRASCTIFTCSISIDSIARAREVGIRHVDGQIALKHLGQTKTLVRAHSMSLQKRTKRGKYFEAGTVDPDQNKYQSKCNQCHSFAFVLTSYNLPVNPGKTFLALSAEALYAVAPKITCTLPIASIQHFELVIAPNQFRRIIMNTSVTFWNSS